MTTRADVVRVAREWVNTPFHHRARVKGIGVDCAGLPIEVCRELGAVAPDFDVPPYTPTPDGHSMIAWCDANLTRVAQDAMQAGDMIITVVDRDPQHIGILADHVHGGFSIIHASNTSFPPRVIETRLMFARNLKFVAAYVLPGIS